MTSSSAVSITLLKAIKVGKALHNIFLLSSLERIEEEGFLDCSSLEEIIIPQNVKKIEDSAVPRPYQSGTGVHSFLNEKRVSEKERL